MKRMIAVTVAVILMLSSFITVHAVDFTILLTLSALPHFTTWDKVGYQARITLSDGSAIPDGTHVFTFTLHNHETASSPLWSENRTESTTNGLLSLYLGEVTPLVLDDIGSLGQDTARELYLEVIVDGETITPRTEIVATPFALVGARVMGDVETSPGRLVAVNNADDSLVFQAHDDDVPTAETVHLYLKSNGVSESSMESSPAESRFDLSHLNSSGEEIYVESVVDELQGIVVLCNTDNSDSAVVEQFVNSDSGTVSVRMNKADLISEVSSGVSQTKEHILLGRQVGLPGAVSVNGVLLKTDDGTSTMSLESSNSSGYLSEQTTTTGNSKFDMVATQVNPVPGPEGMDSSRIVSMMDELQVLYAQFVNGDTAVSTSSSSDKRKQSLYFPETFLQAIELMVETLSASIKLNEINPASGVLENKLMLESNGNISSQGNLIIAGDIDMTTTSGALIVPRLTTSQRDALAAVNGMIIYNTSTNQFNFYENNAWVTK